MNRDLPALLYSNTLKAGCINPNLPYKVLIQRIQGFRTKKFSFVTDSLDDAIFYRNFVLDLIGRKRPDDLEPSPSYRAPAEPRLWAPIPVKLED